MFKESDFELCSLVKLSVKPGRLLNLLDKFIMIIIMIITIIIIIVVVVISIYLYIMKLHVITAELMWSCVRKKRHQNTGTSHTKTIKLTGN